MRRSFLLLIAALCLIMTDAVRAQPLPSDPRLVTGELDNGLRYIVRQHGNPPNRAAIWLHVASGSLNETDRQRGIAHFLEHMAFNGSANFPPGSVIPFFQSLGLTFGQHQNAFTSFDQTTFQLALPDTKAETLQQGMLFLSDVAMRLNLAPKEIESERQVILEERRTRLGGRQRVGDYWFEHLAPGSTFGQRIPIGTEETILAVQQADFKDYYSAWYIPSNMTVMVVADMEPEAAVAAIRKNFSGGEKKQPPANRDAGIKPYEATRAIVASDAELTDAQVSIVWIGRPEPMATTVPLYRRDLVDSIGAWCFNRRLQKKVSDGKVSFLGGGASAGDLFGAGLLAQVSCRGVPEKWEQMLSELAIETQRAYLHGFSEQEIADAKKEIQAGAERAVETEATLPAQAILGEWDSAITDGVPITSAAQSLEITKQCLPGITSAEVGVRFRVLFDTTKPVAFGLQIPSNVSVPTEEQLIAAGQKALNVTPEGEAESKRATALLEKIPEPAAMADLAEDAATNVWSGWLANGARVHYRFMDYRKDQVTVSITFAGGNIEESAGTIGRTGVGTLAWNRPATSKLSSNDIRDLMTGKKIRVGGGAGADLVGLSVSGSPADLEFGMQLAHLLMTDPVVEQAAFDQWVKQQKLAISQRKLEARGVLSELLAEAVYPADEARVRPMTEAQVDSLTAAEGQARLRDVLAKGPIEVAVVGDIDRRTALELVARYVGSLPARARIGATTLDALRGVKPLPGPVNEHRQFKTTTDQAIGVSGFYGVDARNLLDVRLMSMAARILTTRATEQIREQKQLAYSPSVGSTPGTEYPALGIVAMVSPTAPDKVQALLDATREMYDAFAKDGPSETEMETAKKQMANTLDEQMREPGFWLGVLGSIEYRGRTLASVMEAPAAYQGFTATQVKEAFGRYYKPERRFELWVAPEASAQPEAPPQPVPARDK